MSKRKKKIGQCVYCREIGPITRDHIPPRNLFARPRPHNLITVPSCYKCNKAYELHDEYFRLMLCMRDDVSEHPQAKRLQPKLIEALKRPRMKRLLRQVQQGMEPAAFYTWSGLYAGTFPAYEVNLKRLSVVVARIAKGLFYHETDRPFPEEYAVIGVTEPFANASDPDDLERRMAAVLSGQPKIISEGVFSYRCLFLKGDPNSSQWYFEFFETVPFFCMTVKEASLTRPNQGIQVTQSAPVLTEK